MNNWTEQLDKAYDQIVQLEVKPLYISEIPPTQCYPDQIKRTWITKEETLKKWPKKLRTGLKVSFQKDGFRTTYLCKCGLMTLNKDMCSECLEYHYPDVKEMVQDQV